MRGSISKRGDRYRAQVYIGRGADGRPKYRSKSFTTKKLAESWVMAQAREIERGSFIDISSRSLSEWLDYWLDYYASGSVSPKTLQEYRKIIGNYIKPGLGRIRIAQLRPEQVQKYYRDLLDNGSRRPRAAGENGEIPKRGLSRQTVRHHHTLLHKALRDAVRDRSIPSNPIDGVTPPRPERKSIRTFTAEESRRITESAAGTPYQLPILIAMYTGMRRGEVLGLQWRDINFADAQINVQRSLEQTQGGLRLKDPKTAKSRRSVPISAVLMFALRSRRGESPDDSLVCERPGGGPMSPDALTAGFTSIRRGAGIESGSLHTLRHTFATNLLTAGIHPKVVQELLGHSTISTTMDRYSHVTENLMRSAVDAFAEALAGDTEEASG